eukprot:3941946-Rhodomonas_salina.10
MWFLAFDFGVWDEDLEALALDGAERQKAMQLAPANTRVRTIAHATSRVRTSAFASRVRTSAYATSRTVTTSRIQELPTSYQIEPDALTDTERPGTPSCRCGGWYIAQGSRAGR